MKKYSILSVLLCLSLLFGGCSGTSAPYRSELFAMSTYITQTLYGNKAEVAAEQVDRLLKETEQRLSMFIEGSEIDNINQAAGICSVKVSEETLTLIEKGKEYSRLSGGLFDITVAPLTRLWGIDTPHAKVPTPEEIKTVLPLIDYQNILIDEKDRTVKLMNPGMALDLGALAKGDILTQVKSIYQENQIPAGLISIGGNIFVFGKKPDGKQFTLGVRDPLQEDSNALLGTLYLTDTVVATTGSYERYLEKDGVRYGHVLSTKTGYPAETDLLSVTVICPDGGLADFLSTTLYMAGSEAIPNYLNNDRFQVIVVDQDRQIYLSDALTDIFTLTNESYQIQKGQFE